MAGTLMLSVSGCRGIVGETLTPEVARAFAMSYGSWLRERGRAESAGEALVVIGRDGRAGGEAIHAGAIRGLGDAGCAVVDLDVAMTPTVAIMTDSYSRQRGSGARAGGM